MPLRAHFLNVGRGDCTIIEFPSGRMAMIDIFTLKTMDDDTALELAEAYTESTRFAIAKAIQGDARTALREYLKKAMLEVTDPIRYYQDHFGTTAIFRFIATHPDMDHLTGLKRLWADSGISIWNFWHAGGRGLDAAKEANFDDTHYYRSDWETYKQLRNGATSATSIEVERGDSRHYWVDDGMEIWAPAGDLVQQAVDKTQPNIMSLILKISYAGRSILIGGDATRDETWPEIFPVQVMSDIDILKASHHGRKTGYHQPSVKEMSPWLTITSVGEKAHDATNNYRRYSQQTVSLRDTGDLVLEIGDDGVIRYPAELEDHWLPQTPS
jgi:competence protein ComEC